MAVLWMLGNPHGGVSHMLAKMAAATRRARLDPVIRETAETVAGSADYPAQAAAVLAWVQSNIRYLADPVDSDVLRYPADLLIQRYGDCDDLATLVGSLLESIGHPVQYMAVGFYNDQFSHVFAQTRIGNEWVTADATPRNGGEGGGSFALGEEPPGITSRRKRNV